MKIKHNWLFITLFLLVIAALFIYSDKKRSITEEEFKAARNSQLQVFSLDIPDNLTFAGEKVPMDIFWVREAYDRELLTNVYWHSSTFLMLKRTNRYLPVIEPILKKNEIPDDFKYLALAESNFSNTVSPAGASGFWQFLKETGERYGLEINEEVDERYNLAKSTEAACRYFRDAYNRFGSWTLAAAAYNAGIENVTKPMTQQRSTDFYSTLLNQETTRYLFRIMAMREVFLNPEQYGFHFRKKDLYPVIPVTEVIIDSTLTNLASFAIDRGLNYKILKEFNPWLRKNNLTNKQKKTYILLIPDPQNIYYSKLWQGMSTQE
ncbi:MAG: transglycosylase SLT domain-containing protein [Bacteroidetes bacterium]|nr:transglycosylase SLT domain-containing protein [Bacteroidota bacterium]